jgi:hypothetical protein
VNLVAHSTKPPKTKRHVTSKTHQKLLSPSKISWAIMVHIVFKRRIFTMVRIIPSIPSHPPSVDGNGVMVNNPIVKMVTKNKLDLDYSQ